MDAFEDYEEPTKDREFSYGGRQFTLKVDGQFGLWSVVPKKGAVPKALSGQYTAIDKAQMDIVKYVNGNSST